MYIRKRNGKHVKRLAFDTFKVTFPLLCIIDADAPMMFL